MSYNLAVVGATGAVGETILNILAERNFPVAKVHALASSRSIDKMVNFGETQLFVEDLATFDLSQVQIALFSAGGNVSAEYATKAAEAGCIVIDNTSHFRRDKDVPLVIPEVNAHAIANYTQRNIIANPNCSTMQMLVALKPLHDQAKITRINVATYQAVSGSGRSAITELVNQCGEMLNGKPPEAKVYPVPIAFNVIPEIDTIQPNGYTREEMKMVWEIQKILEDPDITVNPTAVRVPVLYGHSEAIHIETREKLTANDARQLLQNAPGVTLLDDMSKHQYPTPQQHAAGHDAVFVGRIREDISHPTGLNLWVVADNIRKGAALNAVQIAEILVAEYL